jgi:hypothetical protein
MNTIATTSLERAAVFMQSMLDKISERIEQDKEMVSLHFIYCPCERCVLQREIEKERRNK